MLRPIVVSVLLALPLSAQAADLMLSDLKSQGGVQLSVEELKSLLTDAKVVSHHEESTRRWKNASAACGRQGSRARPGP